MALKVPVFVNVEVFAEKVNVEEAFKLTVPELVNENGLPEKVAMPALKASVPVLVTAVVFADAESVDDVNVNSPAFDNDDGLPDKFNAVADEPVTSTVPVLVLVNAELALLTLMVLAVLAVIVPELDSVV